MDDNLEGGLGINGSSPLTGARLSPQNPIAHGQHFSTVFPSGRVTTHPNRQSRSSSEVCELGSVPIDGEMVTGWVIGGGKNVQVSPEDIEKEDNKKVWIRCEWTAQLQDGVLMGGGVMGDVTFDSGSEVPEDEVPSVESLSGVVYYALGGWDDDGVWSGTGCGTINIDFCPYSFIKERANG